MRRTLLTSLSLLALSATALAAPPKLNVRPAVGAMLSTGWQRVVLRVENPADGERIDGEATLHLRDGLARAESSDWAQPLNLAPGESKDLTFDVRTFNNLFPIVDASVVQGRGRASATLAAKTFDAFKSQPDGQVTILHLADVSAKEDPLAGLNGQRLGVRGSLQNRQIALEIGRIPDAQKQDYRAAAPARVITLSTENAPDAFLPLSSFMAIYVDDMAKLNPAQQEAIQRYVAEGGVLAHDGTQELQGREGSGVVATLADPLSAWAWARTLRYGIRPEGGQTLLAPRFSLFASASHFDTTGSGQGWGAAGLTPKPPPFSTVALFLGVYLIVLVPVQYAVLKRLGKREWAWGVTPALALVFAGAAYGIGQEGRRKTQAHQVGSIVELGNGVGRGAVLTNIGLYSPGLADATVSVEAPQVHVWKSSGALNAPAEFRADERHASLRGLRLAQWSVATVSARSEATLGEGVRITSSYSLTDSSQISQRLISVNTRNFGPDIYKIENRTGKVLWKAWFQGQLLGDLSPNETRTVSVNVAPSLRERPDAMIEQMRNSVTSNDNNYLTALLDEPLAKVRIAGSDAPPQKSATMVVVRF